jgi:hypothetical protein
MNLTSVAQIDNNRRRELILDFISKNQGCNKQTVVHYFDPSQSESLTENMSISEINISKKTIYRLIEELVEEGLVRVEKERSNSRDLKLFVDKNNPLVLIPQQFERIESIYNVLLNRFQNFYDSRFKMMDDSPDNIDVRVSAFTDFFTYPLDQLPTIILRIISDSVTFHSQMIWPNKIHDEDSLRKLLVKSYMKLASLSMDNIKFLNAIHSDRSDRIQSSYSAMSRVGTIIELMYITRRICDEKGFKKELEELFDLLWMFTEDIHKFLFPEIDIYKWKFVQGVDDWKKILDIYEKNPKQTARSYYLEDRA